MARKSKDYDEYDEAEEAEDEYDEYEDDDYDDYDDYYEPRRKNPLKAFVIALLVLMVLMAAIIGLLYARLRSANDQVNQLNASVDQLICLSNMENINAVMINDGVPQSQRLQKLNEIAIQQMRILAEVGGRRLLK